MTTLRLTAFIFHLNGYNPNRLPALQPTKISSHISFRLVSRSATSARRSQ
jgi:hypothetical protein